MPTVVEIPGVGEVEFPDSMSDKDIEREARRLSQENQNGAQDIDAVAAFGRSGLKSFLDNVLNLPSAAGEFVGDALATGAAGLQTAAEAPFRALAGEPANLGQRFQANVEAQRNAPFFPARALRSIPSVSANEAIAGVGAVINAKTSPGVSLPQATGAEFAERLAAQGRTDAAFQEQRPTATALGEIAGDVATLLTGRAPIARMRSPKQISPIVKREFDNIADRIAESFAVVGKRLARGGGKAAETGLEGAVLAALNDSDPITTASFAAGGQAAGSLSLFLLESPVKRLLPTVALATVASQIFQAVAPGDRNVFDAFDFAIDKTIGAFALGTMAGLAGLGRLRGSRLEKSAPAIADAITAIPRGALLSVLQGFVKSEEAGNPIPRLVAEEIARNPDTFTRGDLFNLDRAMRSGKKDGFTKEVERLLKKKSFRDKIDEIQ